MGNWRLCHLQTTLLGPVTSFCNITFAVSFLQCHFCNVILIHRIILIFHFSQNHRHRPCGCPCRQQPMQVMWTLAPYQKVADFAGKLPTVFSWCSHSSHAGVCKVHTCYQTAMLNASHALMLRVSIE